MIFIQTTCEHKLLYSSDSIKPKFLDELLSNFIGYLISLLRVDWLLNVVVFTARHILLVVTKPRLRVEDSGLGAA